VYETAEDLRELAALLDRSYARAGAHLRSIFTPERRVAADDLVALLPGVQVLNLATVSRACAPRVAPVDGLFSGDGSGSAPPRRRSASSTCASDPRSARVTRGGRSSPSSSTARPR
jgi:hypothetical protein